MGDAGVGVPRPIVPDGDVREPVCFDCGHLAGVVVARTTGGRDGDLTVNEALTEFSQGSPGALPEDGVLDEALGDELRLFRVPEGRTPAQARDDLAAREGIEEAALVQTVALANHWSWAPGEAASPIGDRRATQRVEEELQNQGRPPAPQGRVIIVDTLVDEDFQAADPAITGDSGPFAGPGASHGTFVAGLIRQMGAAVHCITPGLAVGKHDPACEVNLAPAIEHDVPQPSELDLFFAIWRAASVSRPGDVLNLSLGTYPCSVEDEQGDFVEVGGPSLFILRAAVEFWHRKVDGPIFAAAGNARVEVPFYPAALNNVKAVSPTGRTISDDQVVAWDATKPTWRRAVPPIQQWVVDHAAPGLDLVAHGRHEEMFLWSGSSFASAVMAGWYATGNRQDDPDYGSDGLIVVEDNDNIWTRP